MAVTLQIFEGAAVVQELQHVVVQARLALALAGSNQLLAAPGEAVAIPEASCPATVVTKSSATVNNSVDVKSIVVVAPASGKPNGRFDPSVPRERLEDPIHSPNYVFGQRHRLWNQRFFGHIVRIATAGQTQSTKMANSTEGLWQTPT